MQVTENAASQEGKADLTKQKTNLVLLSSVSTDLKWMGTRLAWWTVENNKKETKHRVSNFLNSVGKDNTSLPPLRFMAHSPSCRGGQYHTVYSLVSSLFDFRHMEQSQHLGLSSSPPWQERRPNKEVVGEGGDHFYYNSHCTLLRHPKWGPSFPSYCDQFCRLFSRAMLSDISLPTPFSVNRAPSPGPRAPDDKARLCLVPMLSPATQPAGTVMLGWLHLTFC